MSINGNSAQQQKVVDMILEIIRIHGTLIANDEFRVKQFGFTAAQYQVVAAIGIQNMPQSAPQIAKYMGMTRQGVQKQLNILIKKAFIVSQTNPYHERSPLYSLTEHGFKHYQNISAMHNQLITHVADKFSLSDLITTTKVLQLFHQYLKDDQPNLSSKD